MFSNTMGTPTLPRAAPSWPALTLSCGPVHQATSAAATGGELLAGCVVVVVTGALRGDSVVVVGVGGAVVLVVVVEPWLDWSAAKRAGPRPHEARHVTATANPKTAGHRDSLRRSGPVGDTPG
jgi:quinol-cytochrome oxidoreductase complex cytochrome b subunit